MNFWCLNFMNALLNLFGIFFCDKVISRELWYRYCNNMDTHSFKMHNIVSLKLNRYENFFLPKCILIVLNFKSLIIILLSLSQVPSARLCRRLCDENPNCNFFTWYSLTDSQTAQSGGDVFGHICFHHQDCAQLDFKCKNCHSGPRSDNCHNRRHRTSSGRK